MKYTLITSQGKIYTFFILAVAVQYQMAYGGTIITPEATTEVQTTVSI